MDTLIDEDDINEIEKLLRYFDKCDDDLLMDIYCWIVQLSGNNSIKKQSSIFTPKN